MAATPGGLRGWAEGSGAGSERGTWWGQAGEGPPGSTTQQGAMLCDLGCVALISLAHPSQTPSLWGNFKEVHVEETP